MDDVCECNCHVICFDSILLRLKHIRTCHHHEIISIGHDCQIVVCSVTCIEGYITMKVCPYRPLHTAFWIEDGVFAIMHFHDSRFNSIQV